MTATLRAQNKQVGECALQFHISQAQIIGTSTLIGSIEVFV
jgi:hypothetical protein